MKIKQRRHQIVSVATILILAFAGLLVFRMSMDMRNSHLWVVHTYNVIDTLRLIEQGAADAETAQRGFLLTGDENYLEPYLEARKALPKNLQVLKTLVADNPSQVDRTKSLEQLVLAKLRRVDMTTDLKRTGATEQAMAILRDGEGRRLMLAIRKTAADMTQVEQELLAERHQGLKINTAEASQAAMFGFALALLFVLGGAVWLEISYRQIFAARKVLADTLENIEDGLLALDSHNNIIARNAKFDEILDLAGGDAKAATFDEIARRMERAVDPAWRGLLSWVNNAAGSSTHYRGRMALGQKNIDIRACRSPDGGAILTLTDVTELAHAERMLTQSQKMEAIGQLTGGIAHDFNNLLQVIQGNLDLILATASLEPRQAQRLQNVQAGAKRGASLTRQLLAFARRQPLQPVAVIPTQIVTAMSELLGRTLGERIELQTIVEPDLAACFVDPGQLENAVLNLALNARDAMPGGGKLLIEMGNVMLDEAYAALHDEVTAGPYVMLAVSDTGTGIPADILPHVFTPFFSTKKEGDGTGLGLSMVFGFIKQSGGHVKVYSEIGEGTTVKLYLPKAEEPVPPSAKPGVAAAASRGEKVLVVEDDAAVRENACEILRTLGYRVDSAESADAALALLQAGLKVDVLFTDVLMPGQVSTRELARQAAILLPEIQILYTSGYTENSIVHQGRLDEGVELLSKPYGRDDLARKLRRLLDCESDGGH